MRKVSPTSMTTYIAGMPASVIGASTPPLGTMTGHLSRVNGIAVHGDRLYATHHFALISNPWTSPSPGTLVVLDRVSLAEVHPRIQVGWMPEQVVVNPTANRIYVVNRAQDSLSITVIGLDSLQVESEIPIGFGLVGCAVDTVANVLYVLNHTAGTVVAYDCRDHSVIAEIGNLGRGVFHAAVDEANRWLYVTRTSSDPAALVDEILVIDTSTHELDARPGQINPIPFPSHTRLRQIVHDPGSDHLFVLAQGVGGTGPMPSIIDVDAATRAITGTIIQPGPVAIDVDSFRGLVHLLTHPGLHSYDQPFQGARIQH